MSSDLPVPTGDVTDHASPHANRPGARQWTGSALEWIPGQRITTSTRRLRGSLTLGGVAFSGSLEPNPRVVAQLEAAWRNPRRRSNFRGEKNLTVTCRPIAYVGHENRAFNATSGHGRWRGTGGRTCCRRKQTLGDVTHDGQKDHLAHGQGLRHAEEPGTQARALRALAPVKQTANAPGAPARCARDR